MSKTLFIAAMVATAAIALPSCTPPPKPPPRRFTPNPPNPPAPVDAYGNPVDAYGNARDVSPPGPTPPPDPTPAPRPGEYPTAKSTANPNQVDQPLRALQRHRRRRLHLRPARPRPLESKDLPRAVSQARTHSPNHGAYPQTGGYPRKRKLLVPTATGALIPGTPTSSLACE